MRQENELANGEDIFDKKIKSNITLMELNQLTPIQKFKVYEYLKSQVNKDTAETPQEYLDKLVVLAYLQEHGIENHLQSVKDARRCFIDDKEVGEFENTKQKIFDYAHLNVELLERLDVLSKNGFISDEIKAPFSEHNKVLLSTKNKLIKTFTELDNSYAKKKEDAKTMTFKHYSVNVSSTLDEALDRQNRNKFIRIYSEKKLVTNSVLDKLSENFPSEGTIFGNVRGNHLALENAAKDLSTDLAKRALPQQLSGVEQGTLEYIGKCFLVIGLVLTFPISLPAAALISKYRRGTFDFTAATGVKGLNEGEKINEVIPPAGPRQ